nr:hypothetical protein [Bacteroides intestinalis]
MVTLDVLLKGCLIIPYEEEIIAALSEVCKSYSNEHHSDDDVASLAIAVFSKDSLDDLKSKIEKIYNEKVEKKIELPKCTMRAIATYIIELMIEEVEDESSAINVLALMNCMIILNKHEKEIPYPEVYSSYMSKFDRHYAQKGELNDNAPEECMDLMFGCDNNGNFNSVSESEFTEHINSIRHLLRNAWYYDTEKYITSARVREIDNPYEKVFTVLSHIVNSMPWFFINQRFGSMLDLLDIDSIEQNQTIETIVQTLKGKVELPERQCKSSILLLMIEGNETLQKLSFSQTTLTPREFGAYIYHELMSEKYFE